jgi:hypothetical protein
MKTFPQRALLIAFIGFFLVWVSYVVSTSERAERRVNQTEVILK